MGLLRRTAFFLFFALLISCKVRSECRVDDLDCRALLSLFFFAKPDPCSQGVGRPGGFYAYAGTSLSATRGICATPSGPLLLGTGPATTSFPGTQPLADGSGASNIVLASLDKSGNARWWTFLGQGATAVALARDNDGNIYVLGTSPAGFTAQGKSPLRAHSGGASDAVLAKFGIGGVLEWFTFFGGTSITPGGLRVASNGDLILGGYANTYSLSGFSPVHAHSGAGSDAWFARVASDGRLLWYAFYGGAPTEFIYDLVEDNGIMGVGLASADAGAIAGVSASFSYAGGGNDILLMHLTSGGILDRWTYLGGTGAEDGKGISASPTGFYISGRKGDALPIRGLTSMAGYTGAGSDDVLIAGIGPSMNLLWFTTAGSPADDEVPEDVLTGLDGSCFAHASCTAGGICQAVTIQGVTSLTATGGGNSSFTIKLSSDGNVLWHEFVGTGTLAGRMALLEDGQILTALQNSASIPSLHGSAPLNAFPGSSSVIVQEKPGGGFWVGSASPIAARSTGLGSGYCTRPA